MESRSETYMVAITNIDTRAFETKFFSEKEKAENYISEKAKKERTIQSLETIPGLSEEEIESLNSIAQSQK